MLSADDTFLKQFLSPDPAAPVGASHRRQRRHVRPYQLGASGHVTGLCTLHQAASRVGRGLRRDGQGPQRRCRIPALVRLAAPETASEIPVQPPAGLEFGTELERLVACITLTHDREDRSSPRDSVDGRNDSPPSRETLVCVSCENQR